ncbi:MAG: ribbon-helix-helix protein, CopG family, partial [Myxococcota bacterium]|nr:ribbon-helix-helix protein, CopG family [Myxococcota bacterium]
LPHGLAAKVARLAKERGTTRSQVIRQAIEDATDRSPGSAAELAADLCGVIEGPADLSTHPRHLDDLGLNAAGRRRSR